MTANKYTTKKPKTTNTHGYWSLRRSASSSPAPQKECILQPKMPFASGEAELLVKSKIKGFCTTHDVRIACRWVHAQASAEPSLYDDAGTTTTQPQQPKRQKPKIKNKQSLKNTKTEH
jgi:hypothetical protein